MRKKIKIKPKTSSFKRTPQFLILLDILMLWVFALLSVPNKDSGLVYIPVGEPPIMDGFIIRGKISPDGIGNIWITERGEITPEFNFNLSALRGRSGMQCSDGSLDCFGIFGVEHSNYPLTVYPPFGLSQSIEKLHFSACSPGLCGKKLFFDIKSGQSIICAHDGFFWKSKMATNPEKTDILCDF